MTSPEHISMCNKIRFLRETALDQVRLIEDRLEKEFDIENLYNAILEADNDYGYEDDEYDEACRRFHHAHDLYMNERVKQLVAHYDNTVGAPKQ